jgi:hypothetical protein
MLGIRGETQQFSFLVMPDTKKSESEVEISSSLLVLKGPAITLSNAVTYIEATFVSCIPQIMRPNLNVSIHSVKSLSVSYNASEK